MQSQPLVESSSSPIHQQQRYQRGNSNRIVRHPHLPSSLNRFRLAVRNVTNTFNQFHHHHSVDSVPKSAEQAISMSGHQMGRLRKLTGGGLLNRFRSVSKTASDDDESPAARSGVQSLGCAKTPASRSVSQPDPVESGQESQACGVTGPTWHSPGDDQVKK